MKVYVVMMEPYHDNSILLGVYADKQSALSALSKYKYAPYHFNEGWPKDKDFEYYTSGVKQGYSEDATLYCVEVQ